MKTWLAGQKVSLSCAPLGRQTKQDVGHDEPMEPSIILSRRLQLGCATSRRASDDGSQSGARVRQGLMPAWFAWLKAAHAARPSGFKPSHSRRAYEVLRTLLRTT